MAHFLKQTLTVEGPTRRFNLNIKTTLSALNKGNAKC